MKKECRICPFTKSKAAIEKWTKESCDAIDECAAILKSQGQTLPHPCFLFLDEIILSPAKQGQKICRGHQKWIDRNTGDGDES